MNSLQDEILIKKNYGIYKRFLLIFFVIGAVLSGSIIIFYNIESNDIQKNIMFEENILLNREKEILNQQLGSIFSDLLFLSKHYSIHIPVNTGANKQLNEEYFKFSEAKKIFDQIRFINKNGMEKNRINYNDGNLKIVSKEKLQSKKNRYYFKSTYKLKPGEIYISPLDLNIENGEIEKPFKPMIRFGTPVVNSKGDKIGIILLNYFASNLLENIKELNKLTAGDIMLVNNNGYWLSNPDKTKEWGFLLKDRSAYKFSTEYPYVWNKIKKNESLQLNSSKGIFSSVTIYPFRNNIIANNDSKKVVINDEAYSWKLISFYPRNSILFTKAKLSANLFWLGIVLFVLSSIPSFIIAQLYTRRKLYQQSLLRMANYDKLTELPNRKLFLERLNQNIKISKRESTTFAVLFIDLDFFKSINDTYGHDAGDKLLVKVAKILSKSIRESDTASRIGGDEFAVILRKIKSLDKAKQVALKILDGLNQPFYLNTIKKNISASIGISIFTKEFDTDDILLQVADDAMYLAKKTGKNNVKTYKDLV